MSGVPKVPKGMQTSAPKYVIRKPDYKDAVKW